MHGDRKKHDCQKVMTELSTLCQDFKNQIQKKKGRMGIIYILDPENGHYMGMNAFEGEIPDVATLLMKAQCDLTQTQFNAFVPPPIKPVSNVSIKDGTSVG